MKPDRAGPRGEPFEKMQRTTPPLEDPQALAWNRGRRRRLPRRSHHEDLLERPTSVAHL